MYKLLSMYDFKMHLRDKALNFKFLQDDPNKKDCSKHPLLKMQTDVQLQNSWLSVGVRKFFTDPPRIDRCHPP